MTLPIDEAVYERAANQPRPDNWVEPFDAPYHGARLGALFATSGLCFFADFSEFQPYYDSSYPYPIASMRAYNGYRLDAKVVGNWQRMQPDLASGKLRMVIIYVVFIPGTLTKTMAGLRQVFGNIPDYRLVPMDDMEAGSGFAGPGNHSVEANQWCAAFTSWTGKSAKQLGYANAGDWASNWPQHPADLKRITAAYNAKDPGTYGWQFAGGNQTYPIPAGFPRSVAPFGAYIDINVIKKSLDQILVDFGVSSTNPTVEDDDLMPNVAMVYTKSQGIWVHYPNTGAYWWISSMDDVTWYVGNGAANNATAISEQLHADLQKQAVLLQPKAAPAQSLSIPVLTPKGEIAFDASYPKTEELQTVELTPDPDAEQPSYAPYAHLQPASDTA